ncbi:class I SAM-dependent methyltransferase [Angustibacter peucedani]
MSFEVAAGAYGRFMGRYSEPLADQFVELAGVQAGQRVLDVGCGPGALTARLVGRVGAHHVQAVDPSPPFVAAARERFPDVDVRTATAEDLPFDDGSFDVVLAQLVVHFMADPVAGLAEMRRVAREGGTVAACVWDHASGGGPLGTFWRAVNELTPGGHDESGLAGAREGHLAELLAAAGLADVRSDVLVVEVPFASFDEWWGPYTEGVGPAGDHVRGLDDAGREALRARCEELLPPAPFTVRAAAWTALGRA